MINYPKTRWVKPAFLFLFLIVCIIPAKAQLYAGGGFGYYKTKVNNNASNIVKHFDISPELGSRYQRFSAGLIFSYAFNDYINQNLTERQYSFEPYFRYDIIARKGFGFFTDVFYNYTHVSNSSYRGTNNTTNHSHLVGVSPGVYYNLSDRLTALFQFGFVGYSTSIKINGFDGFGINLSMSTSRIGFYYSFW